MITAAKGKAKEGRRMLIRVLHNWKRVTRDHKAHEERRVRFVGIVWQRVTRT